VLYRPSTVPSIFQPPPPSHLLLLLLLPGQWRPQGLHPSPLLPPPPPPSSLPNIPAVNAALTRDCWPLPAPQALQRRQLPPLGWLLQAQLPLHGQVTWAGCSTRARVAVGVPPLAGCKACGQ